MVTKNIGKKKYFLSKKDIIKNLLILLLDESLIIGKTPARIVLGLMTLYRISIYMYKSSP